VIRFFDVEKRFVKVFGVKYLSRVLCTRGGGCLLFLAPLPGEFEGVTQVAEVRQ
jgi:hypothetical protein